MAGWFLVLHSSRSGGPWCSWAVLRNRKCPQARQAVPVWDTREHLGHDGKKGWPFGSDGDISSGGTPSGSIEFQQNGCAAVVLVGLREWFFKSGIH